MGKELVISVNRHETKAAILEDDHLVEIYFQRANEYSLAGSVHKGRVTRVLPGMQSAFVDIGLERDAFLYVSDFFEEHEEYDKIAPQGEDRQRRHDVSQVPGVAESRQGAAPFDPAAAGGAEQKGRRSRRRRSRGRGFPESKYAGEPPTRWAAPEPTPATAVETGEETPSLMPLPGESLAKYRGQEPEAADLTEETATPAPAEELTGEPSTDEAGPEVSRAAASLAEEPNVQAVEADLTESVLSQVEEAIAEAEHARDGGEPAGAQAVSEPDSAGESTPQAEAAAEEPAGPEAAGESQALLQADVRGPGPRYPHRVSRRTRRKMRGAGPVFEARPEIDTRTAPQAEQSAKPQPSITDLLREGQEILVQIAKEPLGQKGARITSHIALPGRYVVYMPTVEHLGVSRKIASDEERMRLRRILQTHRVGVPGGYIIRTAGTGRSEEDIAADMMFLYNLWLDIRQKAEKAPAPALIHHDLDVVRRLLRDQLTDTFKAIWVDNEEYYESVLRFVERLQPNLVNRIKMYTRSTPIFDAFNISAELEKALRPKVWLKSGGYIVVNQTEALVAIDVNTGKFVGKSGKLEDTIVKTNTEAIREIVRQIRLRDLGGIIVIDFIDMDERKNRQKVMQVLEEEMRADRAPFKILQFNDFGLVAITRKRVKQSLERALCSSCPTCDGSGYVKSVQTVIGEILQEAYKVATVTEGPNVMLRVHPEVARVLKSTDNDYIEELEEILKFPVLVKSDPELHPEKFDLA